VGYAEFPPRAELSDLVVCTWEREPAPNGASPAARILPDGCVDLVWRAGQLLVAGPDTEPFMSAPPRGGTIVGLRLRPGIAGRVLGLAAGALRDTRVQLGDVWGARGAELEERIAAAEAPRCRRSRLEDALVERMSEMGEPDWLVVAAIRRLGLPGSRVGSLSEALATSERQLLRRFKDAVGYGPKTLDRVLRFQRFVSRAPSLARGEERLARVAAELGYADQAHLTRECMRLSGLSPARLVASRIPDHTNREGAGYERSARADRAARDPQPE
jgi:AraC-like DNA-binding protein